jgi:hypothetical protein
VFRVGGSELSQSGLDCNTATNSNDSFRSRSAGDVRHSEGCAVYIAIEVLKFAIGRFSLKIATTSSFFRYLVLLNV